MGFLIFKTILCQSYSSCRLNNKFLKPVILPIARLYATDEKQQKDDLKKEKKLAKKLAAIAAEPEYFQTRSTVWTELKKKYCIAKGAKAAQGEHLLKVTLLDGTIVEGFAWDTTPFDVCKNNISNRLATEVCVAKVNNDLWDLERPLESDCTLELLKYDTPEAKSIFWTTAACSLAEALERTYGVNGGGSVCNIGSTQSGFFADIQLKNKTINRKDKAAIEEAISKVILDSRGKIERIEASKSDVNKLFAYNQYKVRTINEGPNDKIAIYRCGSFIDVSSTPFMRNNKKVDAIKVLKIESLASNDKDNPEPLQRVHGIAFLSANELKEFLKKNK